MRIVLADDHMLVRAGLRALAEEIEGVTVVAEAGDGQAALEAVRAHKPDVLVTDVAMTGIDGLALTERVRTEFRRVVQVLRARESVSVSVQDLTPQILCRSG